MRRASSKSLGTGMGWGLAGGPGAVSGGARRCRADGGGSAPRCGAAAARVGAAPPKNAFRRQFLPFPPPPTPVTRVPYAPGATIRVLQRVDRGEESGKAGALGSPATWRFEPAGTLSAADVAACSTLMGKLGLHPHAAHAPAAAAVVHKDDVNGGGRSRGCEAGLRTVGELPLLALGVVAQGGAGPQS